MTAAAHARAVARSILAAGRFKQPSVPHPFSGVLHAIGRGLDAVPHALGRLDGDAPAALIAVCVLVAAGLALLARQLIRRRARRAAQATARGRRAVAPREIEQAAARAEAAGDYAVAVRLRFEAGLAQLAERGALPAPAALRGEQLRQRLRSAAFDELNVAFEAVAYGGRPAGADDARAARNGWERVAAEERR